VEEMDNPIIPIENRDSEDISYTAAQLIQSAEHLYSIEDPRTIRASVLEAITALEARVNDCIFTNPGLKLEKEFVNWLEERTRNDFDSRLSIFIPVATGLPVDKKSKLWNDYKKAKLVRNKIAHTGTKISKTQARKVIDVVYEWLTYLGSAIAIPAQKENVIKFEKLGRFLAAWARLERAIYEDKRLRQSKGDIMIREPITKYLSSGIEDLSGEDSQELIELRKLRNSLVHGGVTNYDIVNDKDIERIERIIEKIKKKKKPKRKK
jgi:hypothetical protein